jgi:transcriptional regulator with XRE-family HTH domain
MAEFCEAKFAFSQRLHKAMSDAGHPARGRARYLSKFFQISDKAAGKWLNGDSIPETSKIPELAKLLGVNSEWLLSGAGDMCNTPKSESDESLDLLLKTLNALKADNKLTDELVRVLQATINLVTKTNENQDDVANGIAPDTKAS